MGVLRGSGLGAGPGHRGAGSGEGGIFKSGDTWVEVGASPPVRARPALIRAPQMWLVPSSRASQAQVPSLIFREVTSRVTPKAQGQ